MPTAICPECDGGVYVDEEIEQGEMITCDECGEDLEVVNLDPIELNTYIDYELGENDDD